MYPIPRSTKEPSSIFLLGWIYFLWLEKEEKVYYMLRKINKTEVYKTENLEGFFFLNHIGIISWFYETIKQNIMKWFFYIVGTILKIIYR